jgi:hypothetical protein
MKIVSGKHEYKTNEKGGATDRERRIVRRVSKEKVCEEELGAVQCSSTVAGSASTLCVRYDTRCLSGPPMFVSIGRS